jgi:hypothetical protein
MEEAHNCMKLYEVGGEIFKCINISDYIMAV